MVGTKSREEGAPTDLLEQPASNSQRGWRKGSLSLSRSFWKERQGVPSSLPSHVGTKCENTVYRIAGQVAKGIGFTFSGGRSSVLPASRSQNLELLLAETEPPIFPP